MKKINIIKNFLRAMDAKYVNGKKIDDNSYKITFTYKDRNYILDINREYKFIMITTTSSINGIDINNDTLDLIDNIKQMINFTQYEDYNVFSFSVRKEVKNEEMRNILQIVTEMNDIDAILDSEILGEIIEKKEYKAINYDFGLDKFDERLFKEDIFEDFNLKVSTLCEEDLYLIYITLVSYFYKMINKTWQDEVIDPYIIDDMILIIYNEMQNRHIDYNSWFNEWNNYFTDENIENYLNNRDKDKKKELNK